MKTKQKSSTSTGVPPLGDYVSCAQPSTVWEIFIFLLKFPGTQQLSQASLVENACFSDGETETPSKTQTRYLLRYRLRPEELRAREEACSPALQGPRSSHLRYCSEPNPSGSYCQPPDPRLRRRGEWEPQLFVHLFLIKTHGLDQDPALEISFPSWARPPSHHLPFPLGTALRSRPAACPFTSQSFRFP